MHNIMLTNMYGPEILFLWVHERYRVDRPDVNKHAATVFKYLAFDVRMIYEQRLSL